MNTHLNYLPLATDHRGEITALDDLYAQSAEYQQSTTYLDLLNFIVKLPRICPYNGLLVHLQRPGADFVARASDWAREFGRTIKRDARPMVILRTFGPVSFVFDVADTEGDPISDDILRPFATSGVLPPGILDWTVENCVRDRILVFEAEFGSRIAGYANHSRGDFHVTINKLLTREERYSTLVHELAHAYCGHVGTANDRWWPDRSKLHEDTMEVEAESVSYLVCRRIGLQTRSEPYLAEYVQNHEQMPLVSIDTILTVAGYIESMGKGNLPKRKPEHAGARVVHTWGNGKRRKPSRRASRVL